MNKFNSEHTKYSKGFSLIELMVALALGLIMIGAVVTVFLSNQQTARTKQEVDRAQEAFRFASYTITRVVQQGEIQAPLNAQDLLVVIVSPGLGHRDCFGNQVGGADITDTINTFFIDAGRLRCQVVNVRSDVANNTTNVETLVTGVYAGRSEFTYGLSNAVNGLWSDNSQWVLSGAVPPGSWPNVRSVRVLLAMQSEGDSIGPSARFSATMRCGALDIC